MTSSEPAASGSQRQQRGQTFKNAFWNTTRYVLIAGMFALLLTMVILLNEVMTFHNGIKNQVGEAYARGVVLMLDEMNRNPEAYPEERALPVAELAVELDGVRRALHELDLFGKIQPVPRQTAGPATGQVAAGQVEAGSVGGAGSQSAEQVVSLDDQSRALQIRLDRLRDTLYSASPFVAVAAALKDLKDDVEDLQQFEVEPAGEGAAGSGEEAGDTAATLALEGQIKRMQDELDALARGVRALPHAGILSGHLANLKGQIEQLQGYQYVAELHRAADDGGTADAAGASQPGQMVGSTGGTAVAALNEPGNAPSVAAQANAEAEKVGTAGGRVPAADSAITTIVENTKNMERDLRAAFPDFSLFAAVSEHVQAMRDQANTFDGMTGADYRGATDVVLDREAAEELFDQTRDQLGGAINQVETALQGRTRVIALANVIRRNPDLSDTSAAAMARTTLHDFDALERFSAVVMPLQWVAPADSGLARIGIAPKRLATLSTDSIQTIYIFMIGAIGSLLFITRYYLELAIQGRGLGSAPTRPMAWLLFRPFFGIVVAFAVYLLVRAGQFAFGTGTEDGVGTDLNIPILSVAALFAGLLAWQALEAIETRGRRWFSSQTRQPLWASGLDHALRTSGRTIAECGHQIGRSPEQVERWVLFRDKVPVELQDRIGTWLEKSLTELFSENKPAEELGGRPMWAVGLKAALDNREKRLDEAALADLLHDERRDDNLERIRKWINLKLQVSPAMQWQLVDLLQVPHSRLFAPVLQDRDIWALHLRRAIENRGEYARQVADRLGLDVERIHAWKELEATVPAAMQDRLMSTLERGFTALFEPEPKEPDWLILANGLGQAIDRKYGKRDLEAFAAEVDVDVARVQDWIDRKKPVAKDTQKTILKVLGQAGPEDLFSPPKIGA